MPKSRKAEPEPAAEPLRPIGYFHWSREPAVGLFAVLPLWLTYILLRWQLAPHERNGAEVLLMQQLSRLGDRAHLVVSVAFALLIAAAARWLVKHKVPWSRVAAVIALEGLVYGVMLGPIASAMTSSANRLLSASVSADDLVPNLVGSIGAGVFEELVFRLGLMSVLVWVGMRAVREWSLPRWLAGLFAVVVSALVFSWFHHLCGEPYDRGRFLFRTMAGVLLGLLMWGRGYGVCVYTHTVYNLYFYLRP
ncbi:MAG: CPBP family intramembrane metalloprotease [Planctomycetes bacterium]|nr:CPBP family intramembrane metalloprotease [Planctomycetota bacterium]